MRSARLLALAPTFALLACGGDEEGRTPAPTADLTYTVSGVVRGLRGTGLVLALGAPGAPITASIPAGADPASFAFPAKLPAGTSYQVTVAAAPTAPAQVCTVTNGVGTVRDRNVADVDVTCATSTVTVRGAAAGIEPGTVATITLNGAGDLPLSPGVGTYPTFAFSTPIALGASYEVAVKTAPPGRTCAVARGKGTATADVTDVAVTCGLGIGGTVSNLPAGATLVLANGADEVSVTSATAGFPRFSFPTPVAPAAAYAVTVKTQPAGRRCTVKNGAGTMGAAAVTNVEVDCRCAPSALVLGAGTGFEGNFVAALQREGIAVTPVANFTTYDGNPAATGFGATVAFLSSVPTTMPAAGQQSILAAAAAGAGFVVDGWAAPRVTTNNTEANLRALYLFSGRLQDRVAANFALTATTPGHPLLTGVAAPFTTTNSPTLFVPGAQNAPSTTVLSDGTTIYRRGAVAVRESAGAEGRVVHLSVAALDGADRLTPDANLARVALNAVKWATRCE